MTADFTSWLDHQTRRDDPVGDLARDARIDPEWERPATLDELVEYLENHHGSDLCIEAARRAWGEWTASEQK